MEYLTVLFPQLYQLYRKAKKNTDYEYYDLSQEDKFQNNFIELLAKNLFLSKQNEINDENNFEICPPIRINHENALVLDKILECRDAGIQYTSDVKEIKKDKIEPLADRILYCDDNYRKQNKKDFDLLIGKNINKYHIDLNCTHFLKSNYYDNVRFRMNQRDGVDFVSESW
ncbi:MAG: hypothetical protein CMB97_00300 [Flavobacteriaceae bacterium]|nr:hypothetical protein [Flavobacteriaceae bacterium]